MVRLLILALAVCAFETFCLIWVTKIHPLLSYTPSHLIILSFNLTYCSLNTSIVAIISSLAFLSQVLKNNIASVLAISHITALDSPHLSIVSLGFLG